jgi:NADPH2:quinone reductase
VVAVGPGVSAGKRATAVCALLPGGGYAEYVVTPAAHALPVPEGLSMERGRLPARDLFHRLDQRLHARRLKAGERFLVHGGSSGIGTTAIQLASIISARGSSPPPGSAEKCAACERSGRRARDQLSRRGFRRDPAAEGGANLILDMVGGSYIPRNVKALADDGRLVQIAFLQGPKVELNFAQVMVRRLTITGSRCARKAIMAKARIAEELRAQVWPLLDAGRNGAGDGQHLPAGGRGRRACPDGTDPRHIGKIVLSVR